MISASWENNAPNIANAYQSALIMGMGTDASIECLESHEELEFRMRKELCVMKELDMLLQATKYSSKLCGLETICGEIIPGLVADLIVVDGNPDEDISVLYQKPESVFKAGKLVASN